MTMGITTRTAEYKGRTYRLLFLGDTKFGRRAHLQFLNGEKDFWVDAREVVEVSGFVPSSRSGGGNICAECGKPGYLVRDLEDGMYKHRHCCDIEP